MIIHYSDGTFVTLHLGDFSPQNQSNDMCWLKIDNDNAWIRSPYCMNETKEYLLSKQSTSQLDFGDAVRLE